MRTETISYYPLEELSEDAQEKAHWNWNQEPDFQHIYDDFHASLRAFCDGMSISLDDYSYGAEAHRSYIKWSMADIPDVEGIRLATYLWNNHKDLIYSRKYFSLSDRNGSKEKPAYHPMRKSYQITNKCPNEGLWFSSYHSNIQLEKQNCSMTGVYCDEELFDPINRFMAKPVANTTFKELIGECFNQFVWAIQAECDENMTFEYFVNQCEANEYEFTEEGEMI